MTRLFLLCLLTFSIACSSQDSDKIILIGVEEANRLAIAKILEKVCSAEPKVVGVNLFFFGESVQYSDAALMGAIYNCKNVVMASTLMELPSIEGGGLENVRSLHIFSIDETNGFVDFIGDEKDSLTKYFSTFEIIGSGKEYHFSIHIATMVDSLKTSDFLLRKEKIVNIDYRRGERRFTKITLDEILSPNIDVSIFKDKIVIVGYLGPSDDDKFITPLSSNSKPVIPDMYGSEIIANIVSQILEY
jgi:CHASE2 domain-containing sensor protein